MKLRHLNSILLLPVLAITASVCLSLIESRQTQSNMRDFLASRKGLNGKTLVGDIRDANSSTLTDEERKEKIQVALQDKFPSTIRLYTRYDKHRDALGLPAYTALQHVDFNNANQGRLSPEEFLLRPELRAAIHHISHPSRQYHEGRGDGHLYKVYKGWWDLQGTWFHLIILPISIEGDGYQVWLVTNTEQATTETITTSNNWVVAQTLNTALWWLAMVVVVGAPMMMATHDLKSGRPIRVLPWAPNEFKQQVKAIEASKGGQFKAESELLEQIAVAEAATDKAEALNRELKEAYSAWTHDITGPIKSVGDSLALMRVMLPYMFEEENDFTMFFEKCEARAATAYNVLQETRKIARMEETLILDAVEIGAIIETALNISKPVKVDSQATGKVIANVAQAALCINNLIDNSYKYCDREPEVSLSVTGDNKHVTFAVADNGEGIDPAHIDKIWRTGQSSRVSELDRQGDGLGLYSVKKIVEKMGGSVAVESHPGIGSTFQIQLRRS